MGRGRVPPLSLIDCLSLRTPGHVRAAERAAAATKDSKYRIFGATEAPAEWLSIALFVSASFFACFVASWFEPSSLGKWFATRLHPRSRKNLDANPHRRRKPSQIDHN